MAKLGFHKGSSGSPFHTEYYANEGAETGPGGKPSERSPRVGPGTLGRKVMMEWNRGARGGVSAGNKRSGDSDSE
jgi:hypothetical protein